MLKKTLFMSLIGLGLSSTISLATTVVPLGVGVFTPKENIHNLQVLSVTSLRNAKKSITVIKLAPLATIGNGAPAAGSINTPIPLPQLATTIHDRIVQLHPDSEVQVNCALDSTARGNVVCLVRSLK